MNIDDRAGCHFSFHMLIKSPAVTTLIPTYKRNDLLFRSISFSLAQTYVNIKIRVFDNDSQNRLPDRLTDLIARDKRIQYSRNPKNLGALGNFKLCLKSVDTPFFSIQSDDDVILPNLYEDAIRIFEKSPNLGFVALETLTINDDCELVYPCKHDGSLKIFNHQNPTALKDIPYAWTAIVFRRDLAGLFAEVIDTPNEIGADIRCLMRAMSRHDFAVLSKPGACFTAHRTSFSSCRADVEEGTPYYLIQLSRHLDIIYDSAVCETQRTFHRSALRNGLKKNLYFSWIKKIFEELIRGAANLDNIDYRGCALRNIAALKEREGHVFTAMVMSALSRSALFKIMIRIFIRPHLIRKRRLWRREMSQLEDTRYLDIFAHLKTFPK